MRQQTYAELMAEAKREYDAWATEPRVVYLNLPGRASARVRPFWYLYVPPDGCEDCGGAIREAGRRVCRACRRRRVAERNPPCECGAPYYASGMCKQCYESDYKWRRRDEAGRKQKPHESLRRRVA